MEPVEVTFVTGNDYKFKVLEKVLEDSRVKLTQDKMETPEIQSDRVNEVAYYSCWWAYRQLKRPVLLNDVGYFIEALGGFPGPLVKYVAKWLGPEDWLKLMEDKKDRRVVVRSAWAYCKGNEGPKVQVVEAHGLVAEAAGEKDTVTINSVLVPQGFEKPLSELSFDEVVTYWSEGMEVRGEVLKLLG